MQRHINGSKGVPVPSTPTTGAAIPATVAQLIAHLDAGIVAGTTPAGSRLESERKLAERHGVSRPVVREALRILQERGLVMAQPGRGTFVRELRPTGGAATPEILTRRGQVTARQLSAARIMLEGEAAALAAAKRTATDLKHMQALLDSLDATDNVIAKAEKDLAFHEAVLLAARNPVLQVMFGSIRSLSFALMLRSLGDRRVRDTGAPIHHAILAAIRRRDSGAARRQMIKHLSVAETHYGPDLDRPLAHILPPGAPAGSDIGAAHGGARR
ncbi:MAG: FadR family transcriptional regulator [Gammaproteobacteria bacterium]|nr:FadR family transcriptional regulator [Gammaproteobacteria bacterium]